MGVCSARFDENSNGIAATVTEIELRKDVFPVHSACRGHVSSPAEDVGEVFFFIFKIEEIELGT